MAGEKYIALEETSQEIKTAVEGVKTDVAEVNTDVDGVKNDTENIISQLSGGSGVIRHIQRGVSTFTQTTINIQLSGFTNIEKMIAIIDGGWDSRGTVIFPHISSLTESNLAVSSIGNNVNYFVSYQVIEFA